MNKSVIENMLVVSNLLKQDQHDSDMSSTKRQAKIWTIVSMKKYPLYIILPNKCQTSELISKDQSYCMSL